jgi:hypothetical protein
LERRLTCHDDRKWSPGLENPLRRAADQASKKRRPARNANDEKSSARVQRQLDDGGGYIISFCVLKAAPVRHDQRGKRRDQTARRPAPSFDENRKPRQPQLAREAPAVSESRPRRLCIRRQRDRNRFHVHGFILEPARERSREGSRKSVEGAADFRDCCDVM